MSGLCNEKINHREAGTIMLDLKETRGEIDRVDKQIIELFEERMELCKEVAEYKLYTGKPVLDRKRELEKIAVLKSMASDEFSTH